MATINGNEGCMEDGAMKRFALESGNCFRSFSCVLAAVLAVSFSAMDGRAQATPAAAAAQPIPVLTATTREVLLDVVVTDANGAPVTGLTAADFAVSEDGEAQRLTHVEEHHPMSAADLAALKSAPVLPPNTFSNFQPVQYTNASTVILLDAVDTPIQAQMQLREQLIDYMKHVPPGVPIAIFQVDTEMRLIQGFSADPKVLLAAANSKRDQPSLKKPFQGDLEGFVRFRRNLLRDGFRMMGRYLAAYPGRKNLIWFTGDVPESYRTYPLESALGRSFRDDFRVEGDTPSDLTDELTLSRVALYPIDARGLQTPEQYDVNNGGRPSMRRNQGLESARAFQQLDLNAIAEQTGGKAYYNTNGLKEVIAEIVNNGSAYYTLAYATGNQKWEGQFRHIKVKLSRQGLHAQYRQGYYAVDRTKQEQRLVAALQKKTASNPMADEPDLADDGPAGSGQGAGAAGQAGAPSGPGGMVTPAQGAFQASMRLGAIPPTEVILTARLSMGDKVEKLDKDGPAPKGNFLTADYKTKPFRTYMVQIHADAHALRLTRSADGVRHGKVQFVSLVFDQEGRQVNSIMSSASLDVTPASYRQLLAGGMVVQQEIAVPVKGNYFMRMGVHDVGSDRIGALEIPVDAVRAGVASASLSNP
jgi:VWFA-related protein